MKTILIRGAIGWEAEPQKILRQLKEAAGEDIRVIVNSPGGLISSGLEIYNALRAYTGKVELVIGVMAASAAATLAMAVPVEDRKAFDTSTFMAHEVSTSLFDGRERDFRIAADRVEGLNLIISRILARGLGVTNEEARDMLREDNYFIGGQELLDNNIVGGLIQPEDIEGIESFLGDSYEFLLNAPDKLQIAATIQTTRDAATKMAQQQEDLQQAAACAVYTDTLLQGGNMEKNKSFSGPGTSKMASAISVTLDEALQNAEFEQEFNSRVRDAVTAAIEDERDTVVRVLQLADVTLSEEAISALRREISIEEYAEHELKQARAKQSNLKLPSHDVFGRLRSRQLPGEQGGELQAEISDEVISKKVAENMNVGGGF